MRNVRRHFRLDVTVPAVIKLADKNEVIRLVVPELASGAWQRQEATFDEALRHCEQALVAENELAGRVIKDLAARTQLLCEAIILLVQGISVYDRIEMYKTRRHRTPLAMQLKTGSVTADILRAYNEQLDGYFTIVDKGIHQEYSSYLQQLDTAEFQFNHYLPSLQQKVAQGGLLAKCVVTMHDQLIRHVNFLVRFRQEVGYWVDPSQWPMRRLNLSAGGVGFMSHDAYPKFARLTIDFRCPYSGCVDDFHMTGNIVSSREIPEGYYIAVEFTNASEEVQQRIIRFLQNEELNQLIAWQQARRVQEEKLFTSLGDL